MKKPNFTKQSLKDFFFRHIEKLIFGGICAGVLAISWFGFKTPGFNDISPKVMLDKSKQAGVHINDTSHWEKLSPHRFVDTDPAERIRNAKPVDANELKTGQFLGTAVQTRSLRRDPALIPAEDFEVRLIKTQVALNGKVKVNAKPKLTAGNLRRSDLLFPIEQRSESFWYRSDKLKGEHALDTLDVVVGMAKINYQQQLQNFIDNFQVQRSYDSNRDFPFYVAIEVQRKTADTEWAAITAKLYERPSLLADPAKELVDTPYIIDGLTHPIPPMLGLDYRNFCMQKGISMKEVPLDDKDKKNKEDSSDDSEASDDIFGDSSSKKPETEIKEEAADEKDEVPATRLIRFYDLDRKKVGETYSYRLRVWLKDPNDPDFYKAQITKKSSKRDRSQPGTGQSVGGEEDTGKKKNKDGKKGGNMEPAEPPTPLSLYSLHSEVRDRLKMKRDKPIVPKDIADYDGEVEALNTVKQALQFGIATEWVEAEQSVTIGEGFETFVTGPVDAPSVVRNPGGGWFWSEEPSVAVVANSFQADVGMMVPATKKDALRGSLLNYEAIAHLLDPLTWEIKDLFESEDKKGQRKGRRFKTDAIVLDIMGGDRLLFKSKNRDSFFAPGEMLLMDRNGNIEIHNDIEDTTGYRHANFVSEYNDEKRNATKPRGGGDDDNESGGLN